MAKRIISVAAAGALLLGVFAQPTKANMWSAHQEYLTFDAPVALPGVVLAAGTYAFEIPSEGASHSLVRVASRDGRQIYLTAFTREVPRPNADDVPLITFHEAAKGMARPVNVWFPHGQETGKQFIYN